jgi:hypothetical protein
MTALHSPADERRRWRSALDAFAEGLISAQRALAASGEMNAGSPESADEGHDAAIPAAWPPTELPNGAVPEGLRSEAESLLADADALRSQILAAMDRSQPTGRRSSTPVSASPRWSIRL